MGVVPFEQDMQRVSVKIRKFDLGDILVACFAKLKSGLVRVIEPHG